MGLTQGEQGWPSVGKTIRVTHSINSPKKDKHTQINSRWGRISRTQRTLALLPSALEPPVCT